MIKKITSLVLSVLFLCLCIAPASFAAEPDTIEPFDSNLIVSLRTDSWTNVYTGTLPLLFASELAITNNINNRGDIMVRVVYENGTILKSPTEVALGGTLSFTLPTNLSSTPYIVQAMAVDTAAGYYITVNKGTAGQNVYVVNAFTDTWSPIYSDTLPLLFPDTITISNHGASPEDLNVRIVYVDSGQEIESEKMLVAGGASESWTIPADLAGIGGVSYRVEVQAVEDIGNPYFLLIVKN